MPIRLSTRDADETGMDTPPAAPASANTPRPLAITVAGRRLVLKWHRTRLSAQHGSFVPETIMAGLRAGAALEVDLRPLADGQFALLHDDLLDRETTGEGPVREITTAELRRLSMRAPDGTPEPRTPLTFDDLSMLIARMATGDALVHLDVKASADALTDEHITRFRRLAKPIEHRLEVGGRDWASVSRLTDGTGRMARGFDPTYEILNHPELDKRAFARLLSELREATKGADTYYLHHATIAMWLAAGINPVAVLKKNGAKAEAWTIDLGLPNVRDLVVLLARAGVDRLITDDAVGLARLFATDPVAETATD